MSNTKLPKIIAVVGPTASGKSDLAVDIAKYINANSKKLKTKGAEIISADSRQVYKGFDLTSGKVPKDKTINNKSQITDYYYKGIQHHLLDVASPQKIFSVARYQKLALDVIKRIEGKDKMAILCGGTGLYVDSILYGTNFPAIKPNAQLRKKLERLSNQELFEKLKKLDPKRALIIDKNNSRRLIRALEIVLSTGKPIPSISKNKIFDVLIFGIDLPKEKLIIRIKQRILKRIKQGMILEIKKAHNQRLSWKRLESFGLEFKWISRYLQKSISEKEMIDGLFVETVKYAKRQMTWFKRNKDIFWLNKTKPSVWKRTVYDFFINSL